METGSWRIDEVFAKEPLGVVYLGDCEGIFEEYLG